MSIPSSYQTLRTPSEAIFKDRKSKFLAYAFPCNAIEQVTEILAEIKSKHPTARHFCYAYVLGVERDIFRANDDGEPSNSAGQPILGQIHAFGLTNVFVVVVRYFGGVKLGIGGLMNAYKTATKEAIENGEIITQELFQHYRLKFNYDVYSNLQILLNQLNIDVYKHQLETSCVLEIRLKPERVDVFRMKIGNLDVTIEDLGVY